MRRIHSDLVVFVIVASLALSFSSGYSEERDTLNSLEDGAWARQFKITDNFSLTNFTGSLVSLKRHYSPNSAARVGIGLSLNQADTDDEFSDPDTLITFTRDSDSYSAQVDLQYLYYTNPDSRVSLFWGLGPTFQYSKSDATRETGDDSFVSRRKRWSIGVIGSLGVEWFPTKIVGIHAEYGLGALYSSTTDEAIYPRPNRA